jgi:hypothetical protein
MTAAAISSGRVVRSEPRGALPTAVRTPATITASFIIVSSNEYAEGFANFSRGFEHPREPWDIISIFRPNPERVKRLPNPFRVCRLKNLVAAICVSATQSFWNVIANEKSGST